MISSDITSIATYFESLAEEDPALKTFVLETSSNPFELERLDSLSRTDNFSFPALVLLMPIITGGDGFSHDFTAEQELAFSCLQSTNGEHNDMLEKYTAMQAAAWRIIKYLRRDHKARKIHLDSLTYKMAPIEYGKDGSVGYYVIVKVTTSTNYLIGS